MSADNTLSPLDAWLWQQARRRNAGSAAEILREAVQETSSPLTARTILSSGDNGLDRLVRAADGAIVEARWLGPLRLFLADRDSRSFVIAASPTHHEGVIHLLTSVPVSDGRWKRLSRWITQSAPSLASVVLGEDDLLKLGDALAQYGTVRVSRVTTRDLGGASDSKTWPPKHRARPSHREALADARDASIQTLMLRVGDVVLLHLRRDGGATFHSGDFRVFESTVLDGLAQIAADRRRLLLNRERRVDRPPSRPIVIGTLGRLLGAPEAIGALLDSLIKQRDTGVAVFHRNPYFHAVVTDYTDGSNFDLFVTDDQEVVVIPGFRASVGALARLTETVGSRFAATRIEEAPIAGRPSLEELLLNG